MNDNDDRLEAELSALKPHAMSPELRQRIGNEIASPAPRSSRRLMGLIAVGGGLVAACVVVVVSLQTNTQTRNMLSRTTFTSVGTTISSGESEGRVYETPMAEPRDVPKIGAHMKMSAGTRVQESESARVVPAPALPAPLHELAPNAPRDGSPATAHFTESKANPVKVQEKEFFEPSLALNRRLRENRAQVEEYNRREDQPFLLAQREPLSTFSINVDSASYSNVRRMLLQGQLPPKDAVRLEEFVNYFSYKLPAPQGEQPIAVSAEVAACPWRPEHQLVRIGLQGKRLSDEETPPRNLVFLIDTSGSMNAPNRLPLLQQSLLLLAAQLRAQDRVAIVAYAGSAGLILGPTPGDRYEAISNAVNSLHAMGSTNGGEGIQLAYQMARASFIEGGLNRVILGTDGDFNVGVTGSELVRLVEKQRDSGIYLTLLGFGMGNLKDGTMEKLSRHGNGEYAYIDTMAEARRLFVERIAGLVTIAKDVKVQVEFNPSQVQAYRLLGYESRMLQHQDFNDDKKDAGEMGAGHSVIALYEVVPPGVKLELPRTDALKYQQSKAPSPAAGGGELMTVKVRFIPPQEQTSRLLTHAVAANQHPFAQASPDFRFAAAAAAFGLLLRDAPHKGATSYADILAWTEGAIQPDPHGHRAEFLRLVRAAQQLTPNQGGRED